MIAAHYWIGDHGVANGANVPEQAFRADAERLARALLRSGGCRIHRDLYDGCADCEAILDALAQHDITKREARRGN